MAYGSATDAPAPARRCESAPARRGRTDGGARLRRVGIGPAHDGLARPQLVRVEAVQQVADGDAEAVVERVPAAARMGRAAARRCSWRAPAPRARRLLARGRGAQKQRRFGRARDGGGGAKEGGGVGLHIGKALSKGGDRRPREKGLAQNRHFGARGVGLKASPGSRSSRPGCGSAGCTSGRRLRRRSRKALRVGSDRQRLQRDHGLAVFESVPAVEARERRDVVVEVLVEARNGAVHHPAHTGLRTRSRRLERAAGRARCGGTSRRPRHISNLP